MMGHGPLLVAAPRASSALDTEALRIRMPASLSSQTPSGDIVLSSWYTDNSGKSISVSPDDDIAEHSFKKALEVFKEKLTKDPSKKAWLDRLHCSRIEDVQEEALNARSRYEDAKGGSRIRRHLTSFSQKVLHYGKILDVFVQHHPEYVALVWGSMRILFLGIAEHENVLSTVVDGLNRIADSLPRLEISARLYPIPQMKAAVSNLYAHIIKFLIRAFNWYSEGKLRHAYHAITRPATLRYDDLLEHICEASVTVSELASVSSYAEQRDMHLQLRSLSTEMKTVTTVLSQLQQIAVDEQTVKASTRIEIQQSFYELRISQVFAVLSAGWTLDPVKSLRASRFLRDKRRLRSKSSNAPLLADSNLHEWNNQKDSAMVLLRGRVSARFDITDFCADVVDYLQAKNIAVLWVFRGLDTMPETSISVIDILKNLILQALQIRSAKTPAGVDPVVSKQLPEFLRAGTQEDWLNILTKILSLFSAVNIIVDTKAVSSFESKPSKAPEPADLLLQAFTDLLEKLAAIKSMESNLCVIKILLMHYGPVTIASKTWMMSNGPRHFVVYVDEKYHRNQRSALGFANTHTLTKFPLALPEQDSFSARGSTKRLPRRRKKKKGLD